jgi:hypothetical protein
MRRHSLSHSITSSAGNRSEVGIVGLIYQGLRRVTRAADLVLRFGLEIAGGMALVQLFFRRPAGAVEGTALIMIVSNVFLDFWK